MRYGLRSVSERGGPACGPTSRNARTKRKVPASPLGPADGSSTERVMRKIQAPSSKIQRRSKLQMPTESLRLCRGLGPGTWSFSGSWSWVFGSSMMLGAWCLVLLNGCAIGPNYKRPAIDAPPNFRNASDTVSAESIANRRWWDEASGLRNRWPGADEAHCA